MSPEQLIGSIVLSVVTLLIDPRAFVWGLLIAIAWSIFFPDSDREDDDDADAKLAAELAAIDAETRAKIAEVNERAAALKCEVARAKARGAATCRGS
jgi:uncharacterized small protein (DUF1192 family)